MIYEANKKTFRDPGNPNLIFPGQKLQIPSIKDEARAGTYDPTQTYQPFPNRKSALPRTRGRREAALFF